MIEPRTFYERAGAEEWRCRICDVSHGHAPTCALVELRIQVQELGSQLGLYVATMHELLERVDRLLRGSAA